MRRGAVVALLMLGLSVPAFGQNQASCRLFFQAVRADTQTPERLRAGMDEAQKEWWDGKGQKEFPGLCLDGSVTAADKPRDLVIWSKPGSIDQAAVAPGEVYGQTASAIQNTAPKVSIYLPTWDKASISIVSISSDGKLVLPPIYMRAGDRALGWFWSDSPKVLEVALKYLAQEPPPQPTPVAPVARPTVTLQVSPTVIQKGQSATLNWSSTNATALNLTPAIGTVSPQGTMSVSPDDSTNYTITATGPGGEADDTVRVTVSFSFTQN